MDNLYQKLARHLDGLPGGFPPTQSGVELRILRRLFAEDEAALALHLGLIPVEAAIIAHRAGIPRPDAEQRLAAMARKGLIMGLAAADRPIQYMAAQFVIGIWEFHVNDLDQELIRDFNEYLPSLFPEAWKLPQLRTIPVNRSLDAQIKVFTYEKAEELVRQATKLAVAPCICRRERRIAGEGCDRPEEACLVFNMGAELYLRNGLGREIGREEALAILAAADEAGLVLQPGNSQEAMNICCCCGCCCGVLRSLKTCARPAAMAATAFVARLNSKSCGGCGTCTTRCQMEALEIIDGLASLDRDRCIGCGLCVSTCPTGSLTLARKPDPEQPRVPKDGVQSLIQLGRARGRLSAPGLAWMLLKSKMERLRLLE